MANEMNTTNNNADNGQDNRTELGRRRLLQALSASGVVLATNGLNFKWEAPFVEISKLAAEAATTQPATNASASKTDDVDYTKQEQALTDAGGNASEGSRSVSKPSTPGFVYLKDASTFYVYEKEIVALAAATEFGSQLFVLSKTAVTNGFDLGVAPAAQYKIIRPTNNKLELRAAGETFVVEVEATSVAKTRFTVSLSYNQSSGAADFYLKLFKVVSYTPK